NAQTKYML
ncbi:hypothetical protein D039_5264B, partial [Vibrio parahaemolyticus EKP-028]